MTYPGNVHDTQIRVAASLAKAGVSRDDVSSWCWKRP